MVLRPQKGNIRLVFIIIISIFIEDNAFSTTASLPYGPLVNTDIDYFRTFFVIIRTFHIRHAMLVMLYFVLGEEKPVLSAKQGIRIIRVSFSAEPGMRLE